MSNLRIRGDLPEIIPLPRQCLWYEVCSIRVQFVHRYILGTSSTQYHVSLRLTVFE